MRSLLFRAKCVVTAFQSHAFELITAPVGFLEKVELRLGNNTTTFPGLVLFPVLCLMKTVSVRCQSGSGISEYLRLGEYDKVISSHLGGVRARLLKNIANQEVARLERDPKQSKPLGGKVRRVVFLATNSLPYTQSGYSLRTHHLLKNLVQSGIEVLVITRLGYPVIIGRMPSRPEIKIDGVRYRSVVTKRYPWSLLAREKIYLSELENICREFEPDIVHTTTDYSNAFIASNLAAILEVPWVYEIRGHLEESWIAKMDTADAVRAKRSFRYRASKSIEIRSINAASAVVFLSEVSKRELFGRGVESKETLVLRNGFEPVEPKPSHSDFFNIREQLSIGREAKLVGSVSSLVKYEGFDTLIDAVSYLPIDWKVLIVGDGAEKEYLEGLVSERELSDRVIITGLRDYAEIIEWYRILDVFVVPRRDCEVTRLVTPMKTVTAQALRKPIVCSDLEPLREITYGQAVYFEPGNSKALAEAILEANSTFKLKSALKTDTSPMTWAEGAEKLLNLYQLDSNSHSQPNC